MAALLACPECDTSVRAPEGLAAGKKLQCPKCQAIFAVPGSSSGGMRRPTVEDDDDRRARPSRSARDYDDRPERSARMRRDDDENDRPIRKPRKKSSGGGMPAIVWILLVLLLVGGAGAGVYFGFFNKDKDADSDSDKTSEKNGDTGREGRLSNENFKRVKNGMTEHEVTRLLGPASLSQDQNLPSRQIRVLIWNARASQVIAQFANGTLIRIDGSIWDGPEDGVGGPGGNDPIEQPGRLTAGNFKKVQLNMSEPEVLQVIGNPSRVVQDRMQGKNRTRLLEWEDKGAAKPTKVTVGFVDDFLVDASGMIDGKRVNARANAGGGGNNRVTQGNFQRISASMRDGQSMNRAQVIEILGPPTRNLGSQMSINGQQADETLIWRNGGTQITIWFLRGQNIGMHFNDKS